MERPQEIGRFAAMGIVACLVNAGATLLMMDFNLRAATGGLIGVAIVVGLICWVLLGRSAIGRVVVTIWLAFVVGAGLASYAYLLVHHRTTLMEPGVHVLSLIAILANIVALYFLWSAPATAWLQKKADAA